MTKDEMRAHMEAAFAIEAETNAGLRGLIEFVGRDPAHMLWSLGYAKGNEEGIALALKIIAEAA